MRKQSAALLLLFCLAFNLYSAAVAAAESRVIVNCKQYVSLRKSNSSNAKQDIRIPKGMQVTVLEHVSGGYAKVQYFDRTGYIPEKYLGEEQASVYTPRVSDKNPVYCGNYGTAKYIEGRTVVVSIFADDATTAWDFNNETDKHMRLRNRFNLSIACTWLTKQTKRWKPNPGGFIWDWRENSDLYYIHAFSEDIVHGSGNPKVRAAFNNYIHQSIPTGQLLQKYDADNIIYNIYLNAPNSDDYRSWTTAVLYNEVEAERYSPEVCVIVPYGRGRENTPAVLAHEMLHCFGAYDLYETNAYSPITQKYVTYLMNHKPNDLMNHCYFSAYDVITTEFSEVDAYYVGLTNECAAVRKWGLGKPVFERFKPNW